MCPESVLSPALELFFTNILLQIKNIFSASKMTQKIDLAKKFCDFFIALNTTVNADSFHEFASLDSKSFQSTLKTCL